MPGAVKTSAAANVERALSLERLQRAFIELPLPVELVANILETHRVELVQHCRGAIRVPPVTSELTESAGLLFNDRRGNHRPLHASDTCKGKAPHVLDAQWTILS